MYGVSVLSVTVTGCRMPVAVEAGVFKHIEILDISSRGIPARPGGVRCRDPLRRLARITARCRFPQSEEAAALVTRSNYRRVFNYFLIFSPR